MNAALRKALAASRLTETDVAAHLGVDPKTVRRWLSGQRPYPRHRWALAGLLQAKEDALWPDETPAEEKPTPVSAHAHAVHTHRWQVPRETWWELFESAEQAIGILVYSGLFLADDAGVLELLGSQAKKGIKVRILIGDPESQAVRRRGEEEGIGETLAARANNSLLLFHTLLSVGGVEIRTHSTILYNSIYFTEKRVLVNHHVYGFPAAKSPVIEINCGTSPEIARTFKQSFEEVWQSAKGFPKKGRMQ
ncbi:multiprotein-bridging factor 1 family protein [Nocardiopsis alba]|uniref:helix-turn-helix domain-containing protein n=1 Tax=Nocardiopsis alba TaxID=53437 RepID=UPI0036C7BA62